MKINGFLRLAKIVSNYSEYKYRVGAVIARKSPISVGFNQMKTHPFYRNTKNKTIHAEINALIHSKFDDLTNAEIYVYREDRNGNPALARPCDKCMAELKERGIDKIIYSTNEFPYFNVERI